MRDYRFHCEDCDSYSQCQYYHNRKGTSLICQEFQYGSSVIEQIRDEIADLPIRPEYQQTEHEKGFIDATNRALQIIDKYTKGDKE